MITSPSQTERVSRKTIVAKPENTPFIETKALSLSYSEKPVLDRISLPIRRGCITAIVGPSGCGKSSFLAALNRLSDLIPCCKVSGTVLFEGRNILSAETDVIRLRSRIGMIFQKPTPFPFSIRKNITFPLREHGVKDRHVLAEMTESVLSDVGLWDEVKERLNQSARALSGGQQQRLCIARALALKPEALLMDEPCSALDPISSGVVEDLISSLKNRYTIVIVTHNLAQARRISDQTAFFWMQDVNRGGRLIEQGQTRQIFESPKDVLTAAYFSGMRG